MTYIRLVFGDLGGLALQRVVGGLGDVYLGGGVYA